MILWHFYILETIIDSENLFEDGIFSQKILAYFHFRTFSSLQVKLDNLSSIIVSIFGSFKALTFPSKELENSCSPSDFPESSSCSHK